MLVKCPECELQVSDKAVSCPHCGYPLAKQEEAPKRRSAKKRMRLPNGFGRIAEIKGRNLRNPFRASVTVGHDEFGHPIGKPLQPKAYFATYNEAYAALVEYNKNPYDLSPSITVSELYARWSQEYFKTLKTFSSERTITAAWKYCSSVYNMRAVDIRARHIKGCMEEGTAIVKGEVKHPTPSIKSRIKSVFNLMLDYALEFELVDRNYARTFEISKDIIREREKAKRGHIPFTDDEMQKLWDNVDKISYVDVVLIQCYSGWRPQELGLIELKNVDLENGTMIGGIKTEAGTDRIVPIHSKIRELVKKRYDEAVRLKSKYLINCAEGKNSKTLSYEKYSGRFIKIRDRLELNPEHRPHDGRMQFITQAKKYGVDEYAIKYIVGHAINDVTEKVYTKRETAWLKSEIEKIK